MFFNKLNFSSSKPFYSLCNVGANYIYSFPAIHVSFCQQGALEEDWKASGTEGTWRDLVFPVLIIITLAALVFYYIPKVSLWYFLHIVSPLSFEALKPNLVLFCFPSPEYGSCFPLTALGCLLNLHQKTVDKCCLSLSSSRSGSGGQQFSTS